MKLTEKLIQNKDITQDDVCPIEVEYKEITFDKISKAVSQVTEISNESMLFKTRKREIVESRQLVMYYAKIYKLGSWRVIGEYFNKDHATAVYSYNTIINLNKTNKKIRRYVNEIEKLL